MRHCYAYALKFTWWNLTLDHYHLLFYTEVSAVPFSHRKTPERYFVFTCGKLLRGWGCAVNVLRCIKEPKGGIMEELTPSHNQRCKQGTIRGHHIGGKQSQEVGLENHCKHKPLTSCQLLHKTYTVPLKTAISLGSITLDIILGKLGSVYSNI